MTDIFLKLGLLMGLTVVIGFFIALIIKLIVLIIHSSGNLAKYDRNYLKEIQRARSIKRIHIKRMYRDTAYENEIISSRYGSNYDDVFKSKK
ncbi:MAG: hypothetical protein ACOYO1_01140 [Bacteroidales bacterium]